MDHRTSMILQAIAWGSIFGTFIVLFIAMIFDTPETTREKFKVVDSYKSCDVVQYNDPSQRYQYFLHCS
jgi:hypothetical protein